MFGTLRLRDRQWSFLNRVVGSMAQFLIASSVNDHMFFLA